MHCLLLLLLLMPPFPIVVPALPRNPDNPLQFDKYMNEYKISHPGLTDRDLPRFEDMDHNNNGHINFHEVQYGHLGAKRTAVLALPWLRGPSCFC